MCEASCHEVRCKLAGLMAIPSTTKQAHLCDAPSTQKPQRKRKLRAIVASAGLSTDGSPDPKKQNHLQLPSKPPGLHARPRSGTPAAVASGAHNGASVATPPASQCGVSTSQAADRVADRCASPTASDCSALRRSRRALEGSVARKASGEPKGAGESATGPSNAAKGPSCAVKKGSSAVEATQATAAASADCSVRMQDHPGCAGALDCNQFGETLQDGNVAARMGCDGGEGKENDSKVQAAAAISGCDRERGGDKAKEADGASAETGQGPDGSSSCRDTTTTVGKVEEGGMRSSEGQEEAAGRNVDSSAAVAGTECGSADAEKTPEMVRTEEEVIAELITVLQDLNRRFQQEVVAVASGPNAVAAFLPFRPDETIRQGEDGECVRVANGFTERRSKEGVQILEID